MELYVDIIKETMKSKDMQEYLIEHVRELTRWNWIDMICSVPISLERKVELLEVLTERAEDDDTKEFYKKTAGSIRGWLKKLELKEGELFCLCGYCNEKGERHQFESAPHYSLETVMQYLQEYAEEEDEEDEINYWYTLEKWEPNEEGKLIETVEYMILNRKLCYVCNMDEHNKEYHPVCLGCDLDLPIPFQAGDIVSIDCHPIQPIRHVLILEVSDHRGGGFLQGLYVGQDKKLYIGTIKHNMVFLDTHWTVSRPEIPALYCAEKYEGILSEEDFILREISYWLQGDNEKGRRLEEYMFGEDDIQKVLEFMGKGGTACFR